MITMTPELLTLCVAMLMTGLVGGLFAGLLGIGGGMVIVPMLEFALGIMEVDGSIRMHIAVATSLATMIPTAISSSHAHYKRQSVNVTLARKWIPWMFLGAMLGSVAASFVHSRVLSGIFAVAAVFVGIKLILPARKKAKMRQVPTGVAIIPAPTLIGFLSSMMGTGGGSMTVPVLTMYGEPIHRAVGTSSFFGLLIAFPATVGYMILGYGNLLLPNASIGYVNLLGVAFIAPTAVLTAPVGARLAHALDKRQLSMLFGLFMCIVAVRMIIRTYQG